jgi:hypothetical protein
MSVEFGKDKVLFGGETRSYIKGANPFQEPKYKSSLGAINEKALLEDRTYIYEGNLVTANLGDSTILVQSFIDIRKVSFTDDTLIYRPQVHWGLKYPTGEDVDGYTESAIDVDPLHIFRTIKVLEALPQLNEDIDLAIEDLYDAHIASQRFFYRLQLRDQEKEGQRYKVEKRRRIADLIGNKKLREILQIIPEDIEEIMQGLWDKDIFVATRELEREFKLGRRLKSEFYMDMIAKWNKTVEGFAKGMQETGGAW